MSSTIPYQEFDDESQNMNTEHLPSTMPTSINNLIVERYKLAEILEKTAAELKQGSFHLGIPLGVPLGIPLGASKGTDTQRKHPKRKRKIPKVVSENIFMITFVWQLLCVLGLEAIDALMKHKTKKKEKHWFIGAIVIMVQDSYLIMFP